MDKKLSELSNIMDQYKIPSYYLNNKEDTTFNEEKLFLEIEWD